MAIGILGRKIGMTQVYDDTGKVVPVTVLEAGPCNVLQLRMPQRDGYTAVQLGYLDKKRNRASRSERGHVANLDSARARRRASVGAEAPARPDCEPKRFVREIRGEMGDLSVGQEIGVGILCPAMGDLAHKHNEQAGAKPGDENYISLAQPDGRKILAEKYPAEYEKALAETIHAVDVTGTSKGRGTAGAMKRHNFHGQRASHGVKKCHRHMGGTGQSASPSRVFKGKKMPGRYGNARCTARNLKVVRVDMDNNLLLVLGAVPGANGGFVVIRETNKL